jgi:hypothetical protein
MKECFCIGPQAGAPLCPCRMRRVQVKDGRYVETIDHGPAPTDAEDYSWLHVTVNGMPFEVWQRQQRARPVTRLVPGPFWDTDNPVDIDGR